MSNQELEKAFKFYKNATYGRIHSVMENNTVNNNNAKKHAKVMTNWFSGPNVRRGNLKGFLYRGLPMTALLNNKTPKNSKSFSSWTPNIGLAMKFAGGSKGVILKMNATKVPAYVRYNNAKPAFFNKVGGNTESEILLPPGKIVIGNKRIAYMKGRGFSGPLNIPYTELNVKNYVLS